MTLLKHIQSVSLRILWAITLSAFLLLSACGKDDPQPEPPVIPDVPDEPDKPDTELRIPLVLGARPVGDKTQKWLPTDTLCLVLTEPGGTEALGDTAFSRYAYAAVPNDSTLFVPVSEKDTLFLPSDSSLVDLLAYRPASVPLQKSDLLLSVDTRVMTATGLPLMTSPRKKNLYAAVPEASITMIHQLTRLSMSLNREKGKTSSTRLQTKAEIVGAEGTTIVLHGNPVSGVWSLPDEMFVAYGDTAAQRFVMHSSGNFGYLYTMPGQADPSITQPELTLVVSIPGHAPITLSLNDYLPKGYLEEGTSVNIAIVLPDPTPDPDPEDPDPDVPDIPDPDNPDVPDTPDVPDIPDIPDNPDPGIPDVPDNPDPGPSVLIQIEVTLTDWNDVTHDDYINMDEIQ